MRTSTSIPPTSSRTGTWRSNTCWPMQMFDTQGSESFTGHQDLIAGGTAVNYKSSQNGDNSIIDNPFVLSLGLRLSARHGHIVDNNSRQIPAGGRPVPVLYVRDRFAISSTPRRSHGSTTRSARRKGGAGIWSAFDAIKAVRHSTEWTSNVTTNPNVIFKRHQVRQAALGRMGHARCVQLRSSGRVHEGRQKLVPVDNGPSWVASIVNAVGQSKYWNSCAIVILWDDPGGFYDHVEAARSTIIRVGSASAFRC